MQKGRCGPLMVQGESNVCIGKRDGGEIHSPPVMVESLLEEMEEKSNLPQ